MSDVSLLQYANTILLTLLSWFAKRSIDRFDETLEALKSNLNDHSRRLAIVETEYEGVATVCAIRHAKP